MEQLSPIAQAMMYTRSTKLGSRYKPPHKWSRDELVKGASRWNQSLHSTIDMVRQNLHLLFRPEYPTAIQHGDILENNIHVDEVTGHITGVVGWHDAFIAPFGISLGGVEILFGIQANED
jgi:hypothetical protein